LTGFEFNGLVVAERSKQLRSNRIDAPLLGSFVLSRDPISSILDPGITVVHAAAFLG